MQSPTSYKDVPLLRHLPARWFLSRRKVQCSQPRFKYGANLGDFLASAAVLFSGNDYSKIAVFLTAIHMKPMNKDLYYKIQAKYAILAVDKMWEEVEICF